MYVFITIDIASTIIDNTASTKQVAFPGTTIVSIDHDYNIITLNKSDNSASNIYNYENEKNSRSLTSDHDAPSTSTGLSKESNELNPIKYKRIPKKDVSYIDYMSDQEDISIFYGINDSDNWSEGEEVTSEDDNNIQ